jgi:hypothetical protein
VFFDIGIVVRPMFGAGKQFVSRPAWGLSSSYHVCCSPPNPFGCINKKKKNKIAFLAVLAARLSHAVLSEDYNFCSRCFSIAQRIYIRAGQVG